MTVTAVPLKHTERRTVTRVVLGIRPQAGGSVNHKQTRSSLATQRMYKQDTAVLIAEHVREQGQGRRHTRASLSGTFLQTLPDLVTPLKGHSLSPCSCPATRSAPSKSEHGA